MMGVTELPESKIDTLIGYFEPNNAFYVDNPVPGAEVIDTQTMSSEEVVEIIIQKIK